MKLEQYLFNIDKVKQKALVYKELRRYLNEYLQTDTNSPNQFIPFSAPEISPTGEVYYETVVPQYVIGDVALELNEAIDSLDKEISKLLNKEI